MTATTLVLLPPSLLAVAKATTQNQFCGGFFRSSHMLLKPGKDLDQISHVCHLQLHTDLLCSCCHLVHSNRGSSTEESTFEKSDFCFFFLVKSSRECILLPTLPLSIRPSSSHRCWPLCLWLTRIDQNRLENCVVPSPQSTIFIAK